MYMPPASGLRRGDALAVPGRDVLPGLLLRRLGGRGARPRWCERLLLLLLLLSLPIHLLLLHLLLQVIVTIIVITMICISRYNTYYVYMYTYI